MGKIHNNNQSKHDPFPDVHLGDQVKALFVCQDGQEGWEEGYIVSIPSTTGKAIRIGDDVVDVYFAWSIETISSADPS